MGALSGDIAIAWQNQFSQLEHAVDLEPDNMFSKGSKDFPIWDSTIFQHVPTLFELERALHGLNPAKAPGVDGIGPEVLRHSITASAKKWSPPPVAVAAAGAAGAAAAGGGG